MAAVSRKDYGGVAMQGSKPTYFCPNCKALYQSVKVEAGPETNDREIACRVCQAPLPAREGKFVLKYFMLREGVRVRKWKRTRRQSLTQG
jgi:hypothetical protein